MTDRELLELAAKAAGIDVVRSRLSDPLCMDMLVNNSYRNPAQVSGAWNPLTDDADALRLAVKLNMALTFSADGNCHAEGLNGEYACECSSDPYAATRRAVVRAAAEIGRTK